MENNHALTRFKTALTSDLDAPSPNLWNAEASAMHLSKSVKTTLQVLTKWMCLRMAAVPTNLSLAMAYADNYRSLSCHLFIQRHALQQVSASPASFRSHVQTANAWSESTNVRHACFFAKPKVASQVLRNVCHRIKTLVAHRTSQ